MADITDRELITICDLNNLKIEFANLDNTPAGSTSKTYHTIHSLLQEEYDGIALRKDAKIDIKKLIKPELSDFQYLVREKDTTARDEAYKKTTEGYKIEKEKEEKVLKDKGKQRLGTFFRIKDNKSIEYSYSDEEKMNEDAHVVMEYFDRYNESSKKDEHIGAFLKKWQIIYSGDSYKIAKDEFTFMITRMYENSEIQNIDIEKELAKINFPSREQAINNKKFAKTMNFIIENVLNNIVIRGLIDNAIPVFLTISLGKMPSKVLANILSFLAPHAVGDLTSVTGAARNKLSKDAKEFEDKKNLQIKKSENEKKIENKITLQYESPLLSGIKIVVAKYEKNIVIAIGNDKGLLVDKSLNQGLIPKEFFSLIYTCEKIIEENKTNATITFTGCGQGAKLATILALFFSKKVKGFYINEPTNIPSIVDFTEKDLNYTGSEYKNRWEISQDSSKSISKDIMVIAIGVILVATLCPPLGAAGATIAYLNGLLSILVVSFKELFAKKSKTFENEKMRFFFKFLVDDKIISSQLDANEKLHYKSGEMIGKIYNDSFEKYYNIKIKGITIKLNLTSYLHVIGLMCFYEYSLEEFHDNVIIIMKNAKKEMILLPIDEKNNIASFTHIEEKRVDNFSLKGYQPPTTVQIGGGAEEYPELSLLGERLYLVLFKMSIIQTNYDDFKKDNSLKVIGQYFYKANTDGKGIKKTNAYPLSVELSSDYKVIPQDRENDENDMERKFHTFITMKTGQLGESTTEECLGSVFTTAIETGK
ncbi:MAG: hypothetical protein LBT51_08935 [Fusobacteriaceae bacterium]|nr:hypothetical protein [Fusobacteriaceae bacterium]